MYNIELSKKEIKYFVEVKTNAFNLFQVKYYLLIGMKKNEIEKKMDIKRQSLNRLINQLLKDTTEFANEPKLIKFKNENLDLLFKMIKLFHLNENYQAALSKSKYDEKLEKSELLVYDIVNKRHLLFEKIESKDGYTPYIFNKKDKQKGAKLTNFYPKSELIKNINDTKFIRQILSKKGNISYNKDVKLNISFIRRCFKNVNNNKYISKTTALKLIREFKEIGCLRQLNNHPTKLVNKDGKKMSKKLSTNRRLMKDTLTKRKAVVNTVTLYKININMLDKFIEVLSNEKYI